MRPRSSEFPPILTDQQIEEISLEVEGGAETPKIDPVWEPLAGGGRKRRRLAAPGDRDISVD